MGISESLDKIKNIIKTGVDERGAAEILMIMGVRNFPLETLAGLRLYSEVLPKVTEYTFTNSQRYLHFLWDTLDKSPICINIDFAIPFRRMIAGALFKKCGKNFIADENCRFNFAQGIDVGDDVFFNRGVYIDSKGGVAIGDSVGLAEIHPFAFRVRPRDALICQGDHRELCPDLYWYNYPSGSHYWR